MHNRVVIFFQRKNYKKTFVSLNIWFVNILHEIILAVLPLASSPDTTRYQSTMPTNTPRKTKTSQQLRSIILSALKLRLLD